MLCIELTFLGFPGGWTSENIVGIRATKQSTDEISAIHFGLGRVSPTPPCISLPCSFKSDQVSNNLLANCIYDDSSPRSYMLSTR